MLVFIANVAYADSDGGVCNPPLVFPPAGDIPSNLPGFVIVGESEAVLVRTDTGAEIALVITPSSLADAVQAVPQEALVEGVTYELRCPRCSGLETTVETFTFTVGAALALPTSLGTVEAEPLVRSTANPGGPIWSLRVSLTPSAEMAPWISLYGIQWEVDSARGTDDLQPFRSGGDALALTAVPHLDCPGAYDEGAPYAFPEGELTVRALATPFFGGDALSASVTTTETCDSFVDPPPPDDPPPEGAMCSAGGGSAAFVPAFVAAMAALAFALRRRD